MSSRDEQPATRLLTATTATARPPRRSRRRRYLLAFGGAAVLVVIVVIAAILSHTDGHHPARTAPPPSAGRGPATPAAGADSRTGAQVAAARDLVVLGGVAMFNPKTRDAAVDAVADPSVAAPLRAQFDRAYTSTYARFGLDSSGGPPAGQTLVARAIPVGTRLVSFTPSRATVQIWSAGLIGLAGDSSTHPVAEAWSTATVNLHWDGRSWRWLSGSQSDGPTPVPGLQAPSDAHAIATAAKTFGALNYG